MKDSNLSRSDVLFLSNLLFWVDQQHSAEAENFANRITQEALNKVLDIKEQLDAFLESVPSSDEDDCDENYCDSDHSDECIDGDTDMDSVHTDHDELLSDDDELELDASLDKDFIVPDRSFAVSAHSLAYLPDLSCKEEGEKKKIGFWLDNIDEMNPVLEFCIDDYTTGKVVSVTREGKWIDVETEDNCYEYACNKFPPEWTKTFPLDKVCRVVYSDKDVDNKQSHKDAKSTCKVDAHELPLLRCLKVMDEDVDSRIAFKTTQPGIKLIDDCGVYYGVSWVFRTADSIEIKTDDGELIYTCKKFPKAWTSLFPVDTRCVITNVSKSVSDEDE